VTDSTIVTADAPRLTSPRGHYYHRCETCGDAWECPDSPSERDQYKQVCGCHYSGALPNGNLTACSKCTFSLSCTSCDAGMGITSKEQAAIEGWRDVQPDSWGLSWTWIGTCRDCQIEGD
jgi:hypothetical protein